jgi:hypothetical protein
VSKTELTPKLPTGYKRTGPRSAGQDLVGGGVVVFKERSGEMSDEEMATDHPDSFHRALKF